MAFTQIAQQILRDAEALDAHILSNNLPKPSFSADGPARISFSTKEANASYASLLSNTHRLHHLASGPTAIWSGTMNGPAGDVMTTAAVYHFKIVDYVPLNATNEGVPFEQVAEKCGLALRDFQILVRYTMTNFIFCEPKPGYIAHTAASRVLKENRLIRSLMGMGGDEIFPALVKEVDALEKHPGSQEPTESAWSLANNARRPWFEELATRHPERAETVAFAMEALGSMLQDSVLLGAYDWENLGPARMVDVGGGKGLACRALAKYFPNMSFIVQDLADTVAAGQRQLPADMEDRIKFMTHDFFTPQPRDIGADVFFFRAIFHDWPDKYCIRILQNLIPGLKKGARILIFDVHTPEPLTSQAWQERITRASNLRMKLLFNSHDREASEWRVLFEKTDPRFKIIGTTVHSREPQNDSGAQMAMVEAVWEG